MTGIVSNAGRPDGVRLDVRTAALILVVAIGLSACGGGGSEPAAETASPPAEPEPVASPLPGGSASTICSGETMPIPQYALTVAFDSLWVACRTEGAVLRVDAETGEVVARIPAEGAVSLAADDTSVWAVFRELGELYRIDPQTNEVAESVSLFHDTPYIWAEAGAVWLGYGDGTEIGRLDPETMKVVARVPSATGRPTSSPTATLLLVVCHRDHTLWRLDPATNAAEKLSDLPGDTPERLTLAAGSLWATGRGTDLLRIDPATGETLETIETGVGGIELAAIDGTIWVAVAEPEADRQGLPELERLVPIDAESGELGDAVLPTEPVSVTGMATDGTAFWIADVVGGRLTRAG